MKSGPPFKRQQQYNWRTEITTQLQKLHDTLHAIEERAEAVGKAQRLGLTVCSSIKACLDEAEAALRRANAELAELS